MTENETFLVLGAVGIALYLLSRDAKTKQGAGGWTIGPGGPGLLSDDPLYRWDVGGAYGPNGMYSDDVLRIDITRSAKDFK